MSKHNRFFVSLGVFFIHYLSMNLLISHGLWQEQALWKSGELSRFPYLWATTTHSRSTHPVLLQ